MQVKIKRAKTIFGRKKKSGYVCQSQTGTKYGEKMSSI